MSIKKILHPLMNSFVLLTVVCVGRELINKKQLYLRNKDKGPDLIVLPCAYTITTPVMYLYIVHYQSPTLCSLR